MDDATVFGGYVENVTNVGKSGRTTILKQYNQNNMKTLIAFHNDPEIKTKYINKVRAHREADELIKGEIIGKMDDEFRGCGVVCTVGEYRHSAYPEKLGIPEVLARVEDYLFEQLPDELSQMWPERFLEAIKPGADLSHVHGKFLSWTLLDDQIGFWKVWKNKEDQNAFIQFGEFIAYIATDEAFNKQKWNAVRKPFLASLDRLPRLASLARLARLASLDRLARLTSPDIYEVASEKILELLRES